VFVARSNLRNILMIMPSYSV